ncbi:MAG: hypothetical protein E6Q85_06000 [Thiothrix sp.]|nr:MAG: hypothetical protein E6Q85_06000 [Thiothrix sp.]
MAVTIAEYLGQRTDTQKNIIPIRLEQKSEVLCPFMDRNCDKVSKGLHPVCIVRKDNGLIWIVCEHRLCSSRTKKKIKDADKIKNKEMSLIPHQVNILMQIAKIIYQDKNLNPKEIGIKREASIKIPDSGISYHADYLMRNLKEGSKINRIILEMQGGGETSSTGAITRHLDEWSILDNPTNCFLSKKLSANSIETNAWRRQQEQFIVKGNVAEKTDAKMVLAIGVPLFKYLKKRFITASNLNDVPNEWSLCLIGFDECEDGSFKVDNRTYEYPPNPIVLQAKNDCILFTDYSSFLKILTQQGAECADLFKGKFLLLDNSNVEL